MSDHGAAVAKKQDEFEGWCIIELMGHRRLGAYVTVQEIAGTAFLRLEVPGHGEEPGGTQFVNPQSLYALTPTTELIARSIAASAPRPVTRWDLRAAPALGPERGTTITVRQDDEDGPF